MARFIYIDKVPDKADQETGLVRLVNVDHIEDIYVNENYQIVLMFSSGRTMVTEEDWNQLEFKLGSATHNSDLKADSNV